MSQGHNPETPRRYPRRRVLLAGVTSCASMAGLAGCTSAESSVAESDTHAATGADPQVVARTGDIPVGGGVIVHNVLLVQPVAGAFRAFSVICPHRGARVSPPEHGVITCWEHNSTFNAANGLRIGGPALRGLTELPITVSGTYILMA